MTIKRGEPWGEPGVLPADAPVAHSDDELATLFSTDPSSKVIGLVGGDLHRTVGSPKRSIEQLRNGDGMALPVDLGLVEYMTEQGTARRIFAAHLVATSDRRGRLWKGRTVTVMNAAFRGDENLAPRGHPNDGRLDVIDGELDSLDRRRARERARSGTHVPHPQLHESRVREMQIDDSGPLYLVGDGKPLVTTRSFKVSCLADAVTIVV